MSGEPVYIGADERPWFAQLHRADPVRDTGVGLVIVPPFGYEAVCAHRALRHLADGAAAAGVTAVRIDLDGTGDSAGDDLDPDRVGRWIASIGAAADLVRAAGADRIVIAGVRLGALLGARAAALRADVVGLVAIAPVVSGRKWLREMKALQQALGLRPAPRGAAESEIAEAIGFAITPETQAALTAIELDKPGEPGGRPAPAVLVLDRDDLPPSAKWIEKLRAAGAEVDARQAPGYVEMVLDPHKAVVPAAIIAATIEFAAARPKLASLVPAAAPLTRTRARIAGVIEEDVTFDGLRAIAVRPDGASPKRAVILLNAGAVRRVGPNRLYVTIARRLAAEGAGVLRVDSSGLGDSPARAGLAENAVYHARARADIDAMIAYARRAFAAPVLLAGWCSGGYYAFATATEGASIAAVATVNPGHPPTEPYAQRFETLAERDRYSGLMRSLASWKKLVRGEVDVVRLARTVQRIATGAVVSRAREVARRAGVPLEGDLGSELVQLVKRGVRPTFVFSAGEANHLLFAERGGATPARLEARGAMRVVVLDGPDHTFTARWTHPLVADALSAAAAEIR